MNNHFFSNEKYQIQMRNIMNKNTLKYLCIRKLLSTYEHSFKKEKNNDAHEIVKVTNYFKMLGPCVSTQIFYDIFEHANLESDLYLKFLQYLTWNNRLVDFSVVKLSPKIHEYRYENCVKNYSNNLMSWVLSNCSNLSEINFCGPLDFDEKLFIAIMEEYGHQLKAIELDFEMFENRPTMLSAIGKNCDKLVKLTIWNLYFGSDPNSSFNTTNSLSQPCLLAQLEPKTSNISTECSLEHINKLLFDVENGKSYNFSKTLKMLYFPGLKLEDKSYILLAYNMLYHYAPNLEYTNLPLKLADSVVFLSMIVDYGVSLKLKRFTDMSANCNKTYKKVKAAVKLLPFLEEAGVNLVNLKDKQKKSIIDNLNAKLTSLKICLDPPVSALFYVGKRFKYLQKLEVYFTCLKRLNGSSSCFKEPNSRDLFHFRNLKSFKFSCVVSTSFKIVNTVFQILRSCQDTLKNFEIEGYEKENVKDLLDLVCCKDFALENITFSFVSFLTFEHVMQMVTFYIDKKVSLNVENCSKISLDELLAVKGYVLHNSKKNLFNFNFKHEGSTY